MKIAVRSWIFPLVLAPALLGLRRPEPLKNQSDKAAFEQIYKLLDFGHIYNRSIGEFEIKLEKELRIHGNSENAQVLRSKIESFKSDRDRNYSKAAHLVAKVYDIAPNPPVRNSVLPGFQGTQARWSFVSMELRPLTVVGADGKVEVRQVPPNAAAISSPDGSVVLSPLAFANSDVPMLAAYILHEKRHFEQYTTRGLGDSMSQPDREADAYLTTLMHADILGITQDQKRFLESRARHFNGALAAPEGLDHSFVADSVEGFRFSEEELAQIRSRSAALQNLVRDENSARLAEESSYDEFKTDGLRKDQARTAYDELVRWGKIACEVTDWDRDINWDSWGDNFGHVDPGLQRPALIGPAPCELHLVTMLLDARIQGHDRLPMSSVLGLVAQARQRAREQNLPPARAVARPYTPPRAVASPAVPVTPPEAVSPPLDPDFTIPPGAGDYNRCIHSRCIRWR